MTIGDKIKALRLSKKMTQATLCGDVITRNMLSRIENNVALPSLPTLQHLADTLGVSAGYFLDQAQDPFPYQKLFLIEAIKDAYRNADYTRVLSLTTSLDRDDELAYIEASSFYALADEAYRKNELTTAESLFEMAKEAAAESLYAEETILKKSDYYLSLIRRTLSSKLPELSLDENEYFGSEIECYLYLYMLTVTKTQRYDLAAAIYDTIKFRSTLYRKHINARLSMLTRNNSRAADLLDELYEEIKASECDPVFAINVLTDRETVAGLLGDYEAAYHALLAKNELLDAFRR